MQFYLIAGTLAAMAMASPAVEERQAYPTTTPLICNAAAIARGDCTATAASVPTTTPLICNAAAIARGDCTAPAGSYPTTTPLICNAAAIARGDCTATAASVPTTTAAYAPTSAKSNVPVYTGAAAVNERAWPAAGAGLMAVAALVL